MKSTLLTIALLFHSLAWAQESSNTDYVIVVADLIGNECTGKRHNSHFFTFKIKEVLSGEPTDSTLVSQEIYHDFGARQMLSKIYPSKVTMCGNEEVKGKEVIIKYSKSPANESSKANCNIRWMAEQHRKKSFERLEELMELYFQEQYELDIELFPPDLFLKENNGRLFFSDGTIAKVAIETYTNSGMWVIATVDQ